MTSNISSNSTGHAYRLRPMPINSLNNNSNLSGSSSNNAMSSSNNPSYYTSSSSSSAAPIVASPTWSYSSPSQLARKYANIAPIWCHITKPRQLKKKFASTFHQAQSLVNFYNEDRAPSERRGSLNQSQQQQQQQSSQQQQQQAGSQSNVHSSSSNRHHHDSTGYRQQYTPHYPTSHDLINEPSSSSSRSKKKYTGGALTMHISSRLQSPPPPTPPLSSLAMEEKFANPSERKARIDQLKDLVFNTRVKDTMVGRTDSKNRSTTNLHKANSYKRIDQITNPLDDYQSSMVPPVTPTRKDSHYYHYHLPSNTVSSSIHDNLNRPIVPPPPATTPSSSTTGVSHPTYNYDYLRAKSKEHTRPTYHEPNYVSSSTHSTEMPSSAQIGSSNSAYVGSALTTNPLNAYRTFDDHGYIGKPSSVADKNSSYTSITSYPSYQTPGSSKRRIKKYLLAKGSSGAGLSHQTEPIISNFETLSLRDEEKLDDGDPTSVIIANTHVLTPSPPPPPPRVSSPKSTTHVVPSLQSTPPIPPIPTLSPPSSPAPVPNGSGAAVESGVFSTPNAQLSPSPPSTNINNYNTKIPPVIVVPLSASLTSLNKQQQALKGTSNSALELVSTHNGKEQSPSRSIVPSMADDGCAIRVFCQGEEE